MRLFTENQYDDMDDEEREEWDYRQAIEDERERKQNIAMANKHRGMDMGAILRQKDEERRKVALAALKAVMEEDEPKVEAPIVETEPPRPAHKTFDRGFGGLIELDGASLKTLVILSTYQDENGKCDPSQKSDTLPLERRSMSMHKTTSYAMCQMI